MAQPNFGKPDVGIGVGVGSRSLVKLSNNNRCFYFSFLLRVFFCSFSIEAHLLSFEKNGFTGRECQEHDELGSDHFKLFNWKLYWYFFAGHLVIY